MKKLVLTFTAAAILGACADTATETPVSASKEIVVEQAALAPATHDPNGEVTCVARASGTDATMKFRGGNLVHYHWSGVRRGEGYTNDRPITRDKTYVIGNATFSDIQLVDGGMAVEGWWANPDYRNWLTFKCNEPIAALAVLQ